MSLGILRQPNHWLCSCFKTNRTVFKITSGSNLFFFAWPRERVLSSYKRLSMLKMYTLLFSTKKNRFLAYLINIKRHYFVLFGAYCVECFFVHCTEFWCLRSFADRKCVPRAKALGFVIEEQSVYIRTQLVSICSNRLDWGTNVGHHIILNFLVQSSVSAHFSCAASLFVGPLDWLRTVRSRIRDSPGQELSQQCSKEQVP